MRRGNKNILLPLIRLQNKAVRTLNMTKLKLHYSILNTKFWICQTYLNCQLSAKFTYCFDNGELPNHFDNYFSEIALIHKYQTGLASLQRRYLPERKHLGVSFL